MFRSILRWVVRLGVLAAIVGVVKRVVGGKGSDVEPAAMARNDVWPPVPTAPDHPAR